MNKITTLVSLSEFVTKAQEAYLNGFITLTDFNAYVTRYNKFLQQPLELCQFVPCDSDGNVLEKPIEDDLCSSFFEKQTSFNSEKAYEEAKQRCLFEGWRIKGIDEGLWELENINQDVWINFVGKDAEIINYDGREENINTIQEMFDYCNNTGFKLPLTESALNQITNLNN